MLPDTFAAPYPIERTLAVLGGTLRAYPALIEAVADGAARLGVTPILPDSEAALMAQLPQAALYIGVFPDAPAPDALTALRQAIEQDIPRLIFAGPGVALPPDAAATPYETPQGLRRALVNQLAQTHHATVERLHYVRKIPSPPTPYIAHPYTLLPAAKLAGRQAQLDLLSEWITDKGNPFRVMSVVAIGGMGKSAVTWKWFSDVAPTVMQPLAGRMWWSFYESDAHFENFVIRALAYVTHSSEGEIREITPAERERELIEVLDREPYLIVLDGIERMLIAYARLDAAHLADDDLDAETQNQVRGALGIPKNADQAVFSPNRLRKTADPRAGAFLQKLTQITASRILISTRLYPSDLQHPSGYPMPGSFAIFLTGLDDAEALSLWRSFGCTGEDDELLRIFRAVENYPLLIRALAGEVATDPVARGNFAAWRQAHPDFQPERQRPDAVKSHVMGYALSGLSPRARRTLDTIAAFRMPTFYDNLAALLVGAAAPPPPDPAPRKGGLLSSLGALGGGNKPQPTPAAPPPTFPEHADLDAALTELEGRGLVGWDKVANRYDLHPIVRNVAWSALDEQAKRGLYATLNAHFGALPAVKAEDVRSLDDLTAPIELYNTLIGMQKYDEAFALYTERLNIPMLRRLSANLQRAELLEMLFPDGVDTSDPKLSSGSAKARALNALALAYQMSGQPGRAVPVYFRAVRLAEEEGVPKNVAIGLLNIADALRLTGEFRGAEAVGNRTLLIARAQEDASLEASALQLAALIRMGRGEYAEAERALIRAASLFESEGDMQGRGVTAALHAQWALWTGDPAAALRHAQQAWEWADALKYEADYIRAARLIGESYLAMNDDQAGGWLEIALHRARAANLIEQEIAALTATAELRRRAGEVKAARALLDSVWEQAERGPYRALHADAYNVLSTIEREAGDVKAAGQTATAAYYLSWCNGAPYAYARGLAAARAHLMALSLPEPDDLPPFDERTAGPYLPVEIE